MSIKVFRVNGGWSCGFRKEIWLGRNRDIEGTFYIPRRDNGEWPEYVDLSYTNVEKVVGFANNIMLCDCGKIRGTFEIPRGDDGGWPEEVELNSTSVEKVVGFADRILLFNCEEIRGTFKFPRGNDGEWPEMVSLWGTNVKKRIIGCWCTEDGYYTLAEYICVNEFGYVDFRF
jgi:hypothetical protein